MTLSNSISPPALEILNIDQIEVLRRTITESTARSAVALAALVDSRPPIEVFAQMKFAKLGYHPTIANRRMNVIEQVNQTFTYFVSLVAAEEILTRHPGSAPIRLNLGTSAGSDIESASQSVKAEVFAAVSPTNNQKLIKDAAKVAATRAAHKYVFFYCSRGDCSLRLEQFPEVQVVRLSAEQVWGRCGAMLEGQG